jgi:hypothetical protein
MASKKTPVKMFLFVAPRLINDMISAALSRSEGADPQTDPLHHRQRRMRALQLLRDAEHPDRFPRLVAASYLPEAERERGAKGRFSHVRHRRLLFPAAGRLAGRPFFGKYNTIFWLSLVYCAGQACLAMFVTNRMGFYVGLR